MKIYSLNPILFGGADSPAIPNLIEQFCSALYAGKGGYPTFLRELKVTPDFPMRCFVGIPEDAFTPSQRVLAEAYCQHLMSIAPGDLWVTDQPWSPINPNRVEAPLDRCIFDAQWAISLGLSRIRWEDNVLMSSSAISRQAKLPNREGMFEQNIRLLLALAVYGFSDPMQFFTASK